MIAHFFPHRHCAAGFAQRVTRSCQQSAAAPQVGLKCAYHEKGGSPCPPAWPPRNNSTNARRHAPGEAKAIIFGSKKCLFFKKCGRKVAPKTGPFFGARFGVHEYCGHIGRGPKSGPILGSAFWTESVQVAPACAKNAQKSFVRPRRFWSGKRPNWKCQEQS